METKNELKSHLHKLWAEAGLIDARDLARHLHISLRKLWGMRDAGALPAPLRLGRAVRWRMADITGWIQSGCLSCRPAANAKKGR